MFDYVGLFSAAIMARANSQSPIYSDMEGKLKTQFAKKPALYWIAIGDKDFLYEANREYRKLLDATTGPTLIARAPKVIYGETGASISRSFVPMLFKSNIAVQC